MAISKTLIVTLNQDKAKPREKFFIYRNDVGVDIYIELSNLTYQCDNKRNNFKHANALFKTPTDKKLITDLSDIICIIDFEGIFDRNSLSQKYADMQNKAKSM